MGRKNGHTLAPFVAEHEALLVLENESHTYYRDYGTEKMLQNNTIKQ